MNAKKYILLQQKLKTFQREADRAAGELQQLKKQLKEEFGCDSVKEAKEKLTSLQIQEDKLTKQFESDLARFEEQYGERL